MKVLGAGGCHKRFGGGLKKTIALHSLIFKYISTYLYINIMFKTVSKHSFYHKSLQVRLIDVTNSSLTLLEDVAMAKQKYYCHLLPKLYILIS